MHIVGSLVESEIDASLYVCLKIRQWSSVFSLMEFLLSFNADGVIATLIYNCFDDCFHAQCTIF